nr:ATP-binding protein [Candidatus Enterousia merdequi]
MALKNLRRIKVENFYSFNEEPQEIFFTAETKYSSDSRFDFIEVRSKKSENILPVTLLYGANASGKSNFMEIINVISRLLKRINTSVDTKMPGVTFDKNSAPIAFEFEFVIDDIIYEYCVKYSKSEILFEEFCTFNSNNSLKRLFVRDGVNVSWHKNISISKSIKDEVKERLNTRKDVTILEILNLRNIEPYSDAYNFLAKEKSKGLIKQLFDDPELKDLVSSFLKHADVGITGFSIEKMPDKARLELMKKITDANLDNLNISEDIFYFPLFEHKGLNKKLNGGEESDGTENYLRILTQILPMFLKGGGVYIADELDKGLHPLIIKKIVEMFHDRRINKCGAQLVATTHDVSLMSPDTLTRDEIWFIEKDPQKANSVIYPLSTFTDVRSNYDYKTGYLEGRFGGIPYLGGIDSLAKLVGEL